MTMTPQRFAQIVDAYGADPRRWPDVERAAAQAFAQAHPREAAAPLAAAAALDACLAADVVEPPGRALQRRIVASADISRPLRPPRATWLRRPFMARPAAWWIPGAALAGAGAAGLIAGALAMSLLVSSGHPSVTHEPSYLSTGFDAPGGEGSGE
jgi:hypothetical protein